MNGQLKEHIINLNQYLEIYADHDEWRDTFNKKVDSLSLDAEFWNKLNVYNVDDFYEVIWWDSFEEEATLLQIFFLANHFLNRIDLRNQRYDHIDMALSRMFIHSSHRISYERDSYLKDDSNEDIS